MTDLQIHFNKMQDNQHAPSTIRLKMALSNEDYKEMYAIYVKHAVKLEKIRKAKIHENKLKAEETWKLLLEVIEELKICRIQEKYNDLHKQYEDLTQQYAELDVYEKNK